MRPEDIQNTVARYEKRHLAFGNSPEALGWVNDERCAIRHAVFAESILKTRASSVLDVGCGLAHFYDYLRINGWSGSYTGVDLMPGFLEIARSSHPEATLIEGEFGRTEFPLKSFDFVVASGIFNSKLLKADNHDYIQRTMEKMVGLARIQAASDFLSDEVEYTTPDLWHTESHWALEMAKGLSTRVILRADYMPFEYALFLFPNDKTTEKTLYQDFKTP